MENKGFAGISTGMETPNDISNTEKPLKNTPKQTGRVDINVLKSKLQESENKELKKNIIVLSFLVLSLGALGVYLSLWFCLLNFSKGVLIR